MNIDTWLLALLWDIIPKWSKNDHIFKYKKIHETLLSFLDHFDRIPQKAKFHGSIYR
jgi:hypothetical protein